MAVRRSFARGRGISESQRRKKTWISVKVPTAATGLDTAQFQTAAFLEVPATSTPIGSTQKAGLALIEDPGGSATVGAEQSTLPEESTILRARGSLLFPKNTALEGTASSTLTDQYAFGFGVTDIRGAVQGTFPGPILDADWDGWMFLRQSAVAPVDSDGTMVDVKAMRKLKGGDCLFFAVESVSGDGVSTPAGVFIFDMRLLILLP